ncbi:hypothetical protein [Paractinoplanes bogorensis]|uniref:hypothetical protein n=1 Tax=Paractinoplanes bogorensis TaxID=1610840 RepID=UPI0027DF8DCE|nr:hypothetical protein [Actinoplanes bogorensis]
MIKLQAVVEVPGFDAASRPPWPVAEMAAGSWLELAADCTDRQIGLFVAALADVASPGGRDEVVDTLVAEECLIVPGGLRLTDTVTGMAVVPGCCAGLEDWRDWVRALDGESPWLGHDPGPVIEFADDGLRVWQKGDHGRPAGASVFVHRLELVDLLRSVHRDLVGFLAAVDAWAVRIGLAERGRALVEAVDRHFAITAALEVPRA